MTYIYLNTYVAENNNVYYYVGSHTWDGEGLDPNYHGSSNIARHYKWKPVRIRILEVCEGERKYKAEREWILKYCNRYGIAECARVLAPSYCFVWISKFKSSGKMLNCCAADAAVANRASVEKIQQFGQSEVQKEVSQRHLKLAQKKVKDVLATEEGRKAAVEKAAYMREFEAARRKRCGITTNQRKAYSNHAKMLNANRGKEGMTEKQVLAVTKNVLNAVKKKHESSPFLRVQTPDGRVFEERSKELSELTGIDYGFLRSIQAQLRKGKDKYVLKRLPFSLWEVTLV